MAIAEPNKGAAPSALRGNIAVRDIVLDKVVDPVWANDVGNGGFERALEVSLRNARLLSAEKQAGSYVLMAHLEEAEPAGSGNAVTVTLTVRYSMVERATGKEVLTRRISVPFSAPAAPDAGSERMRIANEGAARANIAKIIEELFAIPPGKVV